MRLNEGFVERLKYVIAPLVLTGVAYFGPEIKEKFNSLTDDQKNSVKRSGGAILTSLVTGAAFYFLYPTINNSYYNENNTNNNYTNNNTMNDNYTNNNTMNDSYADNNSMYTENNENGTNDQTVYNENTPEEPLS
jgi:hypothetical protein